METNKKTKYLLTIRVFFDLPLVKCLLHILELLVWSSVQFSSDCSYPPFSERDFLDQHNKNLASLIIRTSWVSQTTFLSNVCFDNASSGVLVCHTKHLKLKTWANCFKMCGRGGSYLKNLQICSMQLHEKNNLFTKV